jgi:hypothetical protein
MQEILDRRKQEAEAITEAAAAVVNVVHDEYRMEESED